MITMTPTIHLPNVRTHSIQAPSTFPLRKRIISNIWKKNEKRVKKLVFWPIITQLISERAKIETLSLIPKTAF